MLRVIAMLLLSAVPCPSLMVSAHGLPKASPAAVGTNPETLGQVPAAAHKMVEENKISGAVTMVLRHGKVVQFDARGWQDVERQQPLQTDTIFRIYPMSKPITRVAVMLLYEEGRIRLDSPVLMK